MSNDNHFTITLIRSKASCRSSLIDYPDAGGLQAIASQMYSQGEISSAVYVTLIVHVLSTNHLDVMEVQFSQGIIEQSTSRSIIAGKKVTGFSTRGEEEEGVLDTIKSWNRPTLETAAADAGATCKPPS